MKTILVGLTALLIATQCLGGGLLQRLLMNFGIAAEKGAAKKEINSLLLDRIARKEFLIRFEKQDPRLTEAIRTDLLALERIGMKQKLKGFTPKNFEFLWKKGVLALTPKTDHERQVVAWITDNLVDKAVDNLPREFHDNPTRLPIESAMARAVADHQSGELGERITYDRALSQLVFKFDSPKVDLEQASTSFLGLKIDQYLEGVERGESDIDGLSAP